MMMKKKKKTRRQGGGGVCSKPWRKKMKRRGIVRSMLSNKSLSLLPEEIISNDILPKLPVKSIARFKSVSKTWSSLLSDPYFIKLHYNLVVQQGKFSLILNDPKNKRIYSIESDSLAASQKPLHITDYPFVSLQSDTHLVCWGSCNGLVCFTYRRHVSIKIYLWNPSTDECKLVPPPPVTTPILDAPESFKIQRVGLGFGYDFKLDTYKIFMVTSLSDHPRSVFTVVKSYTLSSDSWKANNVHKIPYKILRDHEDGKFVNGALHWMGTRLTPNKTFYDVILSFNVGDDQRFKVLSVPESLNYKGVALLSTFGVLRDNLCVFDNSWIAHTDVWVMKEYGVNESWTKLFTIPKYNLIPNSLCIMSLINSFENGDILLRKGDDDIVLYDKEKKTTIPKLSEVRDVILMSCVSSPVSLNSKIYLKQELGDNSIKIPTPV